MLYVDLTNIENKYNLPQSVIQDVRRELLSLRPSDILTKGKLARNTHISIDFAEKILIDLVNEKILQILIRVDCMNEEYPHSHWFNSLNQYYNTPTDKVCDQCGAPLDWYGAKVGFKRGIYR